MITDSISNMKSIRKQTGVVLIALLLIITVVALGVFLGAANSTTLNNQNQASTTEALALAKQALIGRAVSDSNRPGTLPCPDTNNDGIAELFVGNNCQIGRAHV